MLWMVLIPFMAAAAAPLLQRLLGRVVSVLFFLILVGMTVAVARLLPLSPESSWTQAWPWIPEFGVALALRLDGLSATFTLLITGIGALILLYAGGYMGKDPLAGRLCGLLMLFLGAMLGVVLSDDLFLLFVFWELTSISSYLLIGFKHEKREARDCAQQALLVTGGGGLVMLAGLVLLSMAAGGAGLAADQATRISVLATVDLSEQALFIPAMLLIITGAFAKSAQMPLHFWLPNAMTAPTPVSAYLHSATMVKAGVYLLARLNPVFGDSMVWHVLLTGTGAVTMLGAALMAAGQTDLKRILAYTTVSVLGTLTMLIGVGTELAIKAAVVYLAAHACYKAALFMIAGSIEHATGTRDVRRLGGLLRAMPLSAAAGLLAALSMAGAPPLFGFIGKELLLKAQLDLETVGIVLILVATVTNVLLIAMALIAAVRPFFGARGEAVAGAHEAPLTMLVGPLVLATAGLFIGLVPAAFDNSLGSAMASAIGGRSIVMELKLWHGVSPAALTVLVISVLTLIAGFVAFLHLRVRLTRAAELVAGFGRRGPARLYELGLVALLIFAERVTRLTQTGSLRQYVRVILMVLVALCIYPLARGLAPARWLQPELRWYEVCLAGLTLAGAVAATWSPSRLSAIAMLGVTGVLVAMIFALFSAPDLAITQIMVEALTAILLVLIFYRLPKFTELRPHMVRVFDALVAVAAGAVMAGMVLTTTAVQTTTAVSEQLSSMSRPLAYGRNVVNVILVDFRALDTLGEITVVAVAGLGVYALIRLYPKRRFSGPRP